MYTIWTCKFIEFCNMNRVIITEGLKMRALRLYFIFLFNRAMI